jgi:hypothetical protein
MEIEEVKELLEKREEWVVKGSSMDLALEKVLKILNEEPMYKYDEENHRLINVYGNNETSQEIMKFIENECSCNCETRADVKEEKDGEPK